MISFVFLSHFYALTLKHSTLIYSHSCYSHRFWLSVHTLFSITSLSFVSLFFFFFSKDRGKTKQKPSNAKYLHMKKYRFPKAKDNHFENAIWLCVGEVSVQVTEPRRRQVRRTGPSQIKMNWFCRLFCAMAREGQLIICVAWAGQFPHLPLCLVPDLRRFSLHVKGSPRAGERLIILSRMVTQAVASISKTAKCACVTNKVN